MADLLKDLDFFHLDDLLGAEEKMTRDAVRQFVQREFMPDVERHFADATFPLDLVPRLAELGIFGANLKGYGCAGMNNVAYGLIMQELEAADSGLRSFASVQSALGDVCDLRVGFRGAEESLSSGNGQRQAHRMLRPDRA